MTYLRYIDGRCCDKRSSFVFAIVGEIWYDTDRGKKRGGDRMSKPTIAVVLAVVDVALTIIKIVTKK